MSQSVYLNKARAEQAIALAEPTINKMMLDGVTNRKSLHLVILGLDGEILHEQNIGPDAMADAKRLETNTLVVRSKARMHFRTGKPSIELQARRPHVLTVGDTIWGGSFDHEGIIVAASGVQGYYDETICAIVAAILWGLVMQAQAAHMAKPDKTPLYDAPV